MAAMAAEEYRRRAWVIAAFALIREDAEAWKKDPYPYRLVQTPTGFFYVDPANAGALSPITGAKAGEPLFHVKERVVVANRSIPNLQIRSHQLETTYGRILFNYVALVYPFGNKLPYIDGRVKPSDVEDMILPKLQDTPPPDAVRSNDFIYVDEYLKFCDAMFYLTSFTQICVPAATAKTMTAAPGIVEFKQKLLAENKDRLHDPAVIAKIDAALVEYDRAYLKGDLGEGFLISGKSFNIVRKKLFSMHGAEVGLTESVNVDLIENSLSQGWDIKKFPAMNNSLRAGSFNRGAQTVLGGESVKWLLRASSNIMVTKPDCGSRLGNTWDIDGDNYERIIGFHVITKTGSELVTAEMAQSLVGKKVTIRSPMFCKLEKTDYCEACVGTRLAANPTALSSAITKYGSDFLGMFMSAAHAKGLMLAKMDYKKVLL